MRDEFFRIGRWVGMIAIRRGVIWIRKDNKAGYKLSMPWNPGLFSERNGYSKPMYRFAGFRIFKLLP